MGEHLVLILGGFAKPVRPQPSPTTSNPRLTLPEGAYKPKPPTFEEILIELFRPPLERPDVVLAPVVPNTFRGPAQRHRLTKVNQGTVAKDLNTVIEPGVDVAADVAAINQGLAQRVGDRFVVNGRTYGIEPNGTLYPISGPGFHPLDRGGFRALGVLNEFGDTSRAAEIMKLRNLSPEAIEAGRAAWKAGQK